VAELWETLTTLLIISLIFIAISYFFWKRYDQPTALMIDRQEEKQRLKSERKMWNEVEARMKAEQAEAETKASYIRRKAEERARALPPEASNVDQAWGALGVDASTITSNPTPDAPTFATQESDANRQHRAQAGMSFDDESDNSDVLSLDELVQVRQDPPVTSPTEEPDWGLIDKLSEIAEKDVVEVPDVPEAPELPDLDGLDQAIAASEALTEHPEEIPETSGGANEVETNTVEVIAEPSDVVRWDTPISDDHWDTADWEEE